MLSWPDFDIMSFGYSMNMYLCILGLAFFYSWAVFGTGLILPVRCAILTGFVKSGQILTMCGKELTTENWCFCVHIFMLNYLTNRMYRTFILDTMIHWDKADNDRP